MELIFNYFFLKAAVAVFTALLLDTMDTDDSQALEDIWTPNMRYYVWSDYNDLIPMTKCMLRVLKSLLRDTEDDFGLTVKYKSVSRHQGLYQKLSLDRVFEVENFLKNSWQRFDETLWYDKLYEPIETNYWNNMK